MATKKIDIYTVQLSKILGRGSYGNVYKGINEKTKQPVAIKIIPKDRIDHDKYLKVSLVNEIKIMQAVHNEHIVQFLDVMETPTNYYIVEQLCDGDLSQIINQGKKLPQQYCIEILTQLCEGFLALVREGVIHRDLKPANILRKGNRFKIADFGFSKQIEAKQVFNEKENNKNSPEIKMNTAVGTPLYMPIEILKSLNYTSKCDIWALGFIFYELLHGDTPWNGCRQFQLVHNIENKPLVILRQDLSKHTLDFLTRCLQKEEKDRISWNQIFVHPIFRGRFLSRADENKQYENKMKSIMTKLRFYFHLNRESLEIYLTKYGYKGFEEELSFDSYFEFLKVANPKITENEALYIFKKTDLDGNGAISLEQILTMLHRYGIAVEDPRQHLESIQEGPQTTKITRYSFEQSLAKFFNRLYSIITKYRLTLKRIFGDFDVQKKGYLTFPHFKAFLQKFLPEMTDQDVLLSFRMMDQQQLQKIGFESIQQYFCKYNPLQSKSQDFK